MQVDVVLQAIEGCLVRRGVVQGNHQAIAVELVGRGGRVFLLLDVSGGGQAAAGEGDIFGHAHHAGSGRAKDDKARRTVHAAAWASIAGGHQVVGKRSAILVQVLGDPALNIGILDGIPGHVRSRELQGRVLGVRDQQPVDRGVTVSPGGAVEQPHRTVLGRVGADTRLHGVEQLGPEVDLEVLGGRTVAHGTPGLVRIVDHLSIDLVESQPRQLEAEDDPGTDPVRVVRVGGPLEVGLIFVGSWVAQVGGSPHEGRVVMVVVDVINDVGGQLGQVAVSGDLLRWRGFR